jgi:tetratricopeptide (TPR) repeat protein
MWASLAVALWLAPASIARVHAQDAGGDPAVAPSEAPSEVVAAEERRRAAVMLDRSATAYREGRYDAAIVLLSEAYLLSHEPILLYNIGRAYEGAGREADALDAYRRYVDAAPDGPNATLARERMERLDGSLERAREEREAEAAARREEARRDDERLRARRERAARERAARRASPVPWIIAGVGGGALIVGAVLGAVAVERHDDARWQPDQVSAVGTQAEAQELAVGANIGLAAGATLAGVGLTWALVIASEPRGEADDLELVIGPGTIGARGRF